jgi:hypothetical protein
MLIYIYIFIDIPMYIFNNINMHNLIHIILLRNTVNKYIYVANYIRGMSHN